MTVDEDVRLRILDEMASVKERDYRQTCSNRQELSS